MSRYFDPLTYRHPRTIAETEDQRFEWWATGEHVDEQERTLRAQFGEHPSTPRGRWISIFTGAVALLGFAALLAFMTCGSVR
jgi:hypothetical protein